MTLAELQTIKSKYTTPTGDADPVQVNHELLSAILDELKKLNAKP